MTAIADAAAFLAQQWPVFPCGADKKPVTEHGFKDATTEPAAVRALFRRPGATLIGVPTGEASDLAVIDLDVKDGASGLEWLAANQHRLPSTRRHRTRSGGVHLLFRYPAGRRIRNSAGKVAPGVDVRGQGGYIIAPPSDGYTIADDAMPADMPGWLVDLLDPPAAAPAPRPTVAREWRDTSAPGSRYGIAALSDETDAICNAAFGQQETTLNAAGLKIGALIAGGELEATYARETLIRAGLAMASEPGKPAWHAEEIRRKVERAIADGSRNPRQAPERLIRRITEEFAPPEPPPLEAPPDYWQAEPEPAIAPPQAEAPAPPTRPSLPLVYWNDIQPSLEADDFVEGVLTKAAMSVVYGPSNCGKTFWASDLAMHVATGRKWNGREIEAGGVIYCALEGGHGIKNRVAAWRRHHGLDGVEVPFAIIPVTLNLLDPDADASRVCDALHAAAREFGCKVMLTVMDTLARAMAGGNENSPEDMGALVTNGTLIQQATGSHLMWIHHSGKDQAQGARGHSSLRAATDTEIEIGRPDKDSPSTARATKQREMEIEGEWTFRLEAVELGKNRRGKPVTSCIVVPADAEEAASNTRRRNMSGDTRRAYEILTDLIAGSGETGHSGVPKIGADVPASVPADWWRQRFYDRAKPGADQDTKKRAFRRAADNLLELNVVGMNGGRVWLTGT